MKANQVICSMGTLRVIADKIKCSLPRSNEPPDSDIRCYKSYALPLQSKNAKGEPVDVHAVFLREAGADRSKLHVSPMFWEKLCNQINQGDIR